MGSAQEVSGVRGGGSWRQLDSRAWLATGRMDRSAAKCSQHCPERGSLQPNGGGRPLWLLPGAPRRLYQASCHAFASALPPPKNALSCLLIPLIFPDGLLCAGLCRGR